MFNLLNPNHAYIYGLFQTDGHLREGTRNRSQFTLEINVRDKDIIKKISQALPVKANTFTRTRTTNFGTHTSIGLRVCNYIFKEHIKSLGFPVGKKSHIIQEPLIPFSTLDYYRGIIDGDGSVGVTKDGFPFISLITASESLMKSYCKLIYDTCNLYKTINRNKRDNIYNICLYRENAQQLIEKLYYPNCLGLNRKIKKAKQALKWVRPNNIKKRLFTGKGWTPEEDQFILTIH